MNTQGSLVGTLPVWFGVDKLGIRVSKSTMPDVGMHVQRRRSSDSDCLRYDMPLEGPSLPWYARDMEVSVPSLSSSSQVPYLYIMPVHTWHLPR